VRVLKPVPISPEIGLVSPRNITSVSKIMTIMEGISFHYFQIISPILLTSICICNFQSFHSVKMYLVVKPHTTGSKKCICTASKTEILLSLKFGFHHHI
jgi:hypothetical protein